MHVLVSHQQSGTKSIEHFNKHEMIFWGRSSFHIFPFWNKKENWDKRPSVQSSKKMERVMWVAECLTPRWKYVKWLQEKNWNPAEIKCSEGLINSPDETKRTNLFSWSKLGQYDLCGSSAYPPFLKINFAFTELSHREQPWYITAHKTL